MYWNERHDVDDDGHITSFSKLMGLQAVHIGNMIQSRRNNQMDGVLKHWTELGMKCYSLSFKHPRSGQTLTHT